MKRILLALALCFAPASAWAQCSGVFVNNTVCGNITGSNNTPRMTSLSLLPITSAQLDALLGSTKGMIAYRNATVWAGFPNGTGVLSNDGAGNLSYSTAGTGTVTSITQGTGMVLTPSPITTTGSVAIDGATAGNFEAGTSNKVLTADVVFTSETTSTFGTTQSLDFSTFFNTKITLTNNISSFSCSNQKAGQAGQIRFINGAGPYTIPATFGCNMKFAGGVQPTLTATNGAVDILVYQCIATNYCVASMLKNVQ